MLKIGSRGPRVRALQQRLANLGHHVAVDGVFGRGTAAAVSTFQASQGLAPDGVVGPLTQRALDEAGPSDPPSTLTAGAEVLAEVARLHPDLSDVRTATLASALGYLGARELYGTNRGPEIDPMVAGYTRHHRISQANPGPPWCAIFASSAIRLGHGLDEDQWADTPMGDWFGGAWQFENWARARGGNTWTMDPAQGAAPAAVAVMKYEDRGGGTYSGHAGLVLWANHEEGTVTTVDGNVTDSVALRTRPFAHIRGYARWWLPPG